eukprot:3096336-Pyramimonas_sp.AAC.1
MEEGTPKRRSAQHMQSGLILSNALAQSSMSRESPPSLPKCAASTIRLTNISASLVPFPGLNPCCDCRERCSGPPWTRRR